MRDSAGGWVGRAVCGSEWTAAVRVGPSTVALLAGARQRRLELGFKVAGKVGPSPRGGIVIARRRYDPDPTEVSRRVPLQAGVPLRRSAVDCGGLRAVHRDCCRSLWR